jgi:hypothetical protein
MANISQGSTENVVLGEGYSPWALNSNDLYPDSTSYIVGIGTTDPDYTLHVEGSTTGVKIDANTDHLKFLDKDGGANDNGILFQYTETATNAAKLKLFMDVADFNENYIELLIGNALGISLGHQESTNVDGFILNNGSVFKIGTGTAHPVEFHTGNASRMVLGTAGELEITNTSANQLKLNNGTESYTFKAVSDSIEVSTAFDFTAGTALLKTNGKEVLWASDTSGLVSLGYDNDFTDLIMKLSGTASLGYTSAQTGAKFSIFDDSNPQLKLDDGTSSTTFQHDDNAGAPVLRLDSSTLEIEDSVSGGGTQIVLKNGAGDSSTFSQDSTGQALEIVTTDYDLNLYSSHASGNVSWCNAAGTRKVMWQNSKGVFSCMGSHRRDQKWVTTTAGAFTAADDDECFVYLCDTSEADVETAGALTFNLPADSTMTGRYLIVKDTGGLAETYNINITANGSDKIDNNGSGVVSIEQNYGSVTLFEAGGWWTIA